MWYSAIDVHWLPVSVRACTCACAGRQAAVARACLCTLLSTHVLACMYGVCCACLHVLLLGHRVRPFPTLRQLARSNWQAGRRALAFVGAQTEEMRSKVSWVPCRLACTRLASGVRIWAGRAAGPWTCLFVCVCVRARVRVRVRVRMLACVCALVCVVTAAALACSGLHTAYGWCCWVIILIASQW
jgi:hypothetical protein